MKRQFTVIVSAVGMGILSGCASAPPARPSKVERGDYAAAQGYATALIEAALAKDNVAGLSIALVDDQRIVWSQGFGWADVAGKKAATADTLYRVASISKLFTDTAAMQLVEAGKLDLDAPVQTLLPGFAPKSWSGAGTDITPRALMSHHSGLQRDMGKGFQNREPQRFTALARGFDGYLSYAPGQMLSYSNLGLTVLGSVIEERAGQPFELRMREALLAPLGMAHSDFDTAVSASPDMAKSYDGRRELPAVPLRDVPAGGLNSSVNDLSRFMEMLFAGGRSNGRQVLQPDTLAQMFRPQKAAVLDFDARLGLGWFLAPAAAPLIAGGGAAAWHNGSLDGYRSYMLVLPEKKLGVVVLSNSSTAMGPAKEIAAGLMRVALEAKTGIHQPDEKPARPAFVDKPLAPEALRQWVGDYTSPMGHLRVYSPDGKSLRADALGHTLDLRERVDGRFGLSYKLLGMLPVNLGEFGRMGLSRRLVAGRELLLTNDGAGEYLAGERLEPAAADALTRDFVDKYLGDYEIANRDGEVPELSHVRLLQENGLFLAEVSGADGTVRMVLRPVGVGRALLQGPLADSGDMVQALPDENGRARVLAMGFVLRKVAH
ncbi:MAG TPA: serine hydrolase [Janthinobacterium sp.]|nr:serine hydrolase [Janthinobacterium sp.]